MRVVIDANVYVNPLIFRGAPARTVDRWLSGEFVVLISEPILDEIARVTAYEELQKYARLRQNRKEFVQLLAEQAILVEPGETLTVVDADESDNPYVECAVAGGAQYLISGDLHLLDIGEYKAFALSPRPHLTLCSRAITSRKSSEQHTYGGQ